MKAMRNWLAVGACVLGLVVAGCEGDGNGAGGGGDARELIGVWQWSVQTVTGPVSGELILQADGRFSQTIYWNGLMTYDAGLYEKGEGFIHFAVQEHEPQEYLGQPLTWPASFTYYYTVISSDHIVLADRIVNTQWDAYRE